MGGGFGKKNLQGLGKALKWKIYYLIGFSAQASTLGVFFDLNKYASGLESTNLSEKFFGLIFPTKRIFEPTVLLLKKTARCCPFLAVVRCLFHNHLRLKRSSLLNVYPKFLYKKSHLPNLQKGVVLFSETQDGVRGEELLHKDGKVSHLPTERHILVVNL